MRDTDDTVPWLYIAVGALVGGLIIYAVTYLVLSL
jgi:hypothetical protein